MCIIIVIIITCVYVHLPPVRESTRLPPNLSISTVSGHSRWTADSSIKCVHVHVYNDVNSILCTNAVMLHVGNYDRLLKG